MFLSKFRRRRKGVVERIGEYTGDRCGCGCGHLAATIVVNVPPTVDAVLAAQNFEHQLKRHGLA